MSARFEVEGRAFKLRSCFVREELVARTGFGRVSDCTSPRTLKRPTSSFRSAARRESWSQALTARAELLVVHSMIREISLTFAFTDWVAKDCWVDAVAIWDTIFCNASEPWMMLASASPAERAEPTPLST